MSLRFNETSFQDESFNEVIREKLTKALNSYSRKLDIIKSEVDVCHVTFAKIPSLEILDVDILPANFGDSRPVVKTICKLSCDKVTIQIKTCIESNLLSLSTNSCPSFIKPHLLCDDSFLLPIIMTFSDIKFKAISNIFAKKSGVGVTFNDVILDFEFDCSIKILQSTLAKKLKNSMHGLFKSVLPDLIFSLSQHWFNNDSEIIAKGNNNNTIMNQNIDNNIVSTARYFDESELQELSPVNMLKLSTLISSRQTLALIPSGINGFVGRPNLPMLLSRLPSLSHYNNNSNKNILNKSNSNDSLSNSSSSSSSSSSSLLYLRKKNSSNSSINSNNTLNNSYIGTNKLSKSVVDNNNFELRDIINIQNKLYERQNYCDTNIKPHRRKIKFSKKKYNEEEQKEENLPIKNVKTPLILEKEKLSTVIEEVNLDQYNNKEIISNETDKKLEINTITNNNNNTTKKDMTPISPIYKRPLIFHPSMSYDNNNNSNNNYDFRTKHYSHFNSFRLPEKSILHYEDYEDKKHKKIFTSTSSIPIYSKKHSLTRDFLIRQQGNNNKLTNENILPTLSQHQSYQNCRWGFINEKPPPYTKKELNATTSTL